jgi:hypothetical protein
MSLDVPVSASLRGTRQCAGARLERDRGTAGASWILALWPQGQARPAVSTLNALDGAITSNLAIVPTANGRISALASDLTHVIVDISGYFGSSV